MTMLEIERDRLRQSEDTTPHQKMAKQHIRFKSAGRKGAITDLLHTVQRSTIIHRPSMPLFTRLVETRFAADFF